MPKDMKLDVHHADGLTAVKLDGEWIPVYSINIDFKREQPPLVAVEIEIPYTNIEGDRVRVYMHPETVKLLRAAGWTPPKEDS